MGGIAMGRLRKAVLCCASTLILLAANVSAYAEMYVAGQVGYTVPNKLTNVEGTGDLTGVSFSDIGLQNSFMYGAKLGYYFESMKWLGLETEVFNTNPNVKQQQVTGIFGGASATETIAGENVRVLNWAPINVIVRYQAGPLEPYAGVGMGVFFARLQQGGESTSDTNVGLNTQVGLRYKVTKNLAVFGEWKYNRVHLNFDQSTPNQNVGGIKGDYSANLFAFGVGYHF